MLMLLDTQDQRSHPGLKKKPETWPLFSLLEIFLHLPFEDLIRPLLGVRILI